MVKISNYKKLDLFEKRIGKLRASTLLNQEELLLASISCLKSKLLNISLEKGINHEETINVSQKLDTFIIHYQKLKLLRKSY